MGNTFLGFDTKTNHDDSVSVQQAFRNPVLWAVSLGLWMLTSTGMMSFMVLSIMRSVGTVGQGLIFLYIFAYSIAAFVLGMSISYFSEKFEYKINFQTSLVPFALIASGSLILMAFGGVLLGSIYIFSALGCIALIFPYMVGYLFTSYQAPEVDTKTPVVAVEDVSETVETPSEQVVSDNNSEETIIEEVSEEVLKNKRSSRVNDYINGVIPAPVSLSQDESETERLSAIINSLGF